MTPQDYDSVLARLAKLEDQTRWHSLFLQHFEIFGIQSLVKGDLILDLFRKAGLDDVDGVQISDWWAREMKTRTDEKLIQMEDSDPGMAAYMQDLMDRILPKSEDTP